MECVVERKQKGNQRCCVVVLSFNSYFFSVVLERIRSFYISCFIFSDLFIYHLYKYGRALGSPFDITEYTCCRLNIPLSLFF